MDTFKKAKRLIEITQVADLEPLSSGDERYQEMSAGRGSHDLLRMKQLLSGYRGSEFFAKITFTGHRGCGKSTELLRFEHELRESFTCLHVAIEDDLVHDCEYTDLLLCLAAALIERFRQFDAPSLSRLAHNVAEWFSEVTLEETGKSLSEVSLDAGMEAGGSLGFFGTAVRMMARLKSSMIGSRERRKTIRSVLQRHASDLVKRVNELLDEARETLKHNGLPSDLLVVVDNLDRVQPEVGEALFFRNGNLLQSLRTHVIYTAPIALVLAPNNIATVFSNTFTLPMVKVRSRSGRAFKPGIDDLVRLVGRRVELDLLFASRAVVRYLAKMSGGSVRELMRLLQYSQVEARIAGRESIDMASARQAVQSFRIQFERLLVPGQVYYPLLARVHVSHRDDMAHPEHADADQIREFRKFFRELLFNGSILEYNGGESWYDVNPIVREIRYFREELANVREGRGT